MPATAAVEELTAAEAAPVSPDINTWAITTPETSNSPALACEPVEEAHEPASLRQKGKEGKMGQVVMVEECVPQEPVPKPESALLVPVEDGACGFLTAKKNEKPRITAESKPLHQQEKLLEAEPAAEYVAEEEIWAVPTKKSKKDKKRMKKAQTRKDVAVEEESAVPIESEM